MYMEDMGMGGWMGWWMVFGAVFSIALLVAFAVLAVWVGNRFAPVREDASVRAMNIARERYARGDIAREQFEQIRNDLSGHESRAIDIADVDAGPTSQGI